MRVSLAAQRGISDQKIKDWNRQFVRMPCESKRKRYTESCLKTDPNEPNIQMSAKVGTGFVTLLNVKAPCGRGIQLCNRETCTFPQRFNLNYYIYRDHHLRVMNYVPCNKIVFLQDSSPNRVLLAAPSFR
jgi:hypothetical protein